MIGFLTPPHDRLNAVWTRGPLRLAAFPAAVALRTSHHPNLHIGTIASSSAIIASSSRIRAIASASILGFQCGGKPGRPLDEDNAHMHRTLCGCCIPGRRITAAFVTRVSPSHRPKGETK